MVQQRSFQIPRKQVFIRESNVIDVRINTCKIALLVFVVGTEEAKQIPQNQKHSLEKTLTYKP